MFTLLCPKKITSHSGEMIPARNSVGGRPLFFPLLYSVMCLTSPLFFSMVAAVLFTDTTSSRNTWGRTHLVSFSLQHRWWHQSWFVKACHQIWQTSWPHTRTHTHNYLGKSSSCHSSLTSMLSIRNVASAVPILWEDGLQLPAVNQQ